LLIPASAFALPYSALYIFGDSLSDSGNVAAITSPVQPGPSTAYTQGRFTNEFNYADGLAAQLGLSATPSLLGGTNFAFGGARTSTHPDLGAGTSVLGQVSTFIGQPGSADANALYVVLGGANNVRDAIVTFDPTNPTAAANIVNNAANDITLAINALYNEGARHFLVGNSPNLARVPAINGLNNPLLSGLATSLSVLFNTTLSNNLDGLMITDLGIDIRQLDIFAILENVIINSAAYGFTNPTGQCYTGDDQNYTTPASTAAALTCSDPSSYVFWDYIHPTSATHSILVTRAFAAVPEPATLALLLAGCIALLTRKKLYKNRSTPLPIAMLN